MIPGPAAVALLVVAWTEGTEFEFRLHRLLVIVIVYMQCSEELFKAMTCADLLILCTENKLSKKVGYNSRFQYPTKFVRHPRPEKTKP